MEPQVDVLVIGASLAGATTALELARAGHRVRLIEKRAFPRQKPCGEGLLPNGVARLEALGFTNLLDDLACPTFVGVSYRAHGAHAEGTFANGQVGRGVDRAALDSAVLRAAVDAGAELVTAAAGAIDLADDGVTVRAGGIAHTAALLVAADGPRSNARRALDLDRGVPRGRRRFALVRRFRLTRGGSLPTRVQVHAFKGFELYITPTGADEVGLAALAFEDTLRALPRGKDEKHARLLQRAEFPHGEPLGPTLACGPLRVRARAVYRGRAVLAGDAAGYVDAITGEGMSLALETGSLSGRACRSILEDGMAPRTAFQNYARARARNFREHALLTHGLVFLASKPRLARRVVQRLDDDPALFTRLLEVNCAQRSLASLGPLALLRLAVGSGKKRALLPMASR